MMEEKDMQGMMKNMKKMQGMMKDMISMMTDMAGMMNAAMKEHGKDSEYGEAFDEASDGMKNHKKGGM